MAKRLCSTPSGTHAYTMQAITSARCNIMVSFHHFACARQLSSSTHTPKIGSCRNPTESENSTLFHHVMRPTCNGNIWSHWLRAVHSMVFPNIWAAYPLQPLWLAPQEGRPPVCRGSCCVTTPVQCVIFPRNTILSCTHEASQGS
jgi:hypothetical protein